MELYMEPYAEDNVTLNHWIDEQMSWIHAETFHNQEKWVYMSGELGEARFPQFKSAEEAYAAFNDAFVDRMGWLKAYMWERWIRNIRLGNVDLGSDMELELRYLMDDEYFEEWEAAAKKYIVEDYEKILGKERTKKLFDEAWKECGGYAASGIEEEKDIQDVV